ncbi:protein of unknown function DUF2293 [Teratosphaeria destructans]|uniref:DUF2293 domain-containing protein n=1 Tax=Teratosphaeria destructans TaxID=418781 RepID=A0A9W7T0Y1_9PEZI|nr:protein of unknown function DUF2293 [Teratosphaeria destructans]
MAPHTKAGSGRVSRAPSQAREIIKRRGKPYKTEQHTVFAKKRKLDLHTSYHRTPPGYVFMPVGTPELAAWCKELSRQRGLSANTVNAEPHSRHATNPDKVSHHVHRIGYHFKVEVVEDACQELGYIPYQNKYIKESDLVEQRKREAWRKTLASYGIVDPRVALTLRESAEEVRAAIKELFPKIPEKDADEIIEHSWKEGTDRIGNILDLSLGRRVQLAVIARIRHIYTDYDRLLRAFEWREARAEVEPECLKKLIEWRGENDAEDDETLEEIVRETIVIDDDDDVAGQTDDQDSGNVSDTSVEITHHVINVDDLGPESTDEKAHPYAQRVLPRRRNIHERNKIAKQKIDAAKQRLLNAGSCASEPIPIDIDQASNAQPATSAHGTPHSSIYVPGTIRPRPDQYGRYPERVIGQDGHVYRLVNVTAPSHDQYRLPAQKRHHQSLQSPAHTASPSNTGGPRALNGSLNGSQHVVDSIERDERGLRGPPPQAPTNDHRPTSAHSKAGHHNGTQQSQAKLVNPASPFRREPPRGPRVARDAPRHASRLRQQIPYASAAKTPPWNKRPVWNNAPFPGPIPYDSPWPMQQPTMPPSPVPTTTTQNQYQEYGYSPHAAYNQQSTATFPAQPLPQLGAVYRMPYTPSGPVHGAPAPIQWAPVGIPARSPAVPVAPPGSGVSREYAPANGAAAPTQYYYPT